MKRSKFTIIELVALLVLLTVGAAFVIPALSSHKEYERILRDAAQLSRIGQSLHLWGNSNDSSYPLPSRIDIANTTVSETGRSKDTTANIFSVLVNESFLTTETLVSPSERNRNILVYDKYELSNPSNAIVPSLAHWDPGMSANFTAAGGGNISYPHLIPDSNRLSMWTNTPTHNKAIAANRGPEMLSIRHANGQITPTFANPESLTTKIRRGSSSAWSGNVLHNDTHLIYMQDLYQDNTAITQTTGRDTMAIPRADATTLDIHDVLFADEQAQDGQDAHREAYDANQFLGIFTTAGESREDFTAIWD